MEAEGAGEGCVEGNSVRMELQTSEVMWSDRKGVGWRTLQEGGRKLENSTGRFWGKGWGE